MSDLMAPLAHLVSRWASLYNDSSLLEGSVAFLHAAGVLLGGGFAIAADRATLRARRAGPDERARQLELLAGVHRPVMTGLAVAVVSGLLMLAADADTLLRSPVLWVKLGLLALLLANGGVMVGTQHALSAAHTGARPAAGARSEEAWWRRLAFTSRVSFSLWFLVLLGGSLLRTAS